MDTIADTATSASHLELAQLPRLGFGFMRLPRIGHPRRGEIDIDLISHMVDAFLEGGFVYFDTAYVYDGGDSECTIRDALTSRHPRGSYWLTDKLPLWDSPTHAELRGLMQTSLDRCGVQRFDLYLIHSLEGGLIDTAEGCDAWGFLEEARAEGLTRYTGFSCHGSADELEGLLTAHPEIDVVQLQINYADWDDPEIQSRACYECARRHGKTVMVMEPVKGGGLSRLPDDIRAEFVAVEPDAKPASWALRFCGSLPSVGCTLSGMNAMDQLEDNMATFRGFRPLDERERDTLERVRRRLGVLPTLGCTHCGYCMEACPQKILIPGIIEVMDNNRIYGRQTHCQFSYEWTVEDGGDPASCLGCGACEDRCPQHLSIIETLAEAVKLFG